MRDKKRAESLHKFERIIRYRFKNIALLDQALSHSSYIKECKDESLKDNERLEFLGDAFFDAVIGECLYKMHPEAEEGKLSKMRAAIVCEQSLAQAAGRLRLADYMLLGYGEEKNGGRSRTSIIADAAEAVVGAIYLDGGYEEAKKFVTYAFDAELKDAKEGRIVNRDYKSRLQEMLQSKGVHDIQYILKKEEGPDHDKTFTVGLKISGKEISQGSGKSKKMAEQDAAKNALEENGAV